jgi:hypothetical protein
MWLVEILILIAIVVEIVWSICEHKEAVGLLKEIKDILEESNAELAEIRDETVEDEPTPS